MGRVLWGRKGAGRMATCSEAGPGEVPSITHVLAHTTCREGGGPAPGHTLCRLLLGGSVPLIWV